MNKQRTFRHTLLTIALAALGVGGTALAVDEVEPNEGILRAQQLTIGPEGSVTVNGAIGNASGTPVVLDADFYSFHAKAGDVITIDIDRTNNLDSLLTLFGPGPTYRWLYEMDFGRPRDPDSNTILDARIDNRLLLETGIYTVAVTPSPVAFVQFAAGAIYRSTTPGSNGVYTLIISGVTPSVQQISIEIKPGSGEFAPINLKAKGTIPVALLTTDDFNALEVKVDANTLTFGATGTEKSLRRCGKGGEDVNGDGRPDLVCHFENELAKFTEVSEEGIVQGTTNNGTAFEGRGMLKVIPARGRTE